MYKIYNLIKKNIVLFSFTTTTWHFIVERTVIEIVTFVG